MGRTGTTEPSWRILLLSSRFTGLFTFRPSLTVRSSVVEAERTRSQMHTAEMSFLRTVAGHSRRDRVRSSDIRREIGAQPLLLGVGRSQLRWFRHVIKMPPGRLHLTVLQAHPSGRRPRGRPRRDHWRDPVAWERHGDPQEERKALLVRRRPGASC